MSSVTQHNYSRCDSTEDRIKCRIDAPHQSRTNSHN